MFGPTQGFFDPVSGFGEGCAFTDGGKKGIAIPRAVSSDNVNVQVRLLRERKALSDMAVPRRLLQLPREHRAWLRHQHEVTIDFTLGALITIPKSAIHKPIFICAPGGVPHQLNKSASDDTYVRTRVSQNP